MTQIEYGFAESPFGEIIVARTLLGVCDLQFLDHNKLETIHELGTRWGVYTPTVLSNEMAEKIEKVAFEGSTHEVNLDLRGTEFQKRVWHELQRIPFGTTVSYSEIAGRIGQPEAVRAVASAIAQNPIAYLIPCHRVIHSDGSIGQYHWGSDLKRRLIEWEKMQLRIDN